MEEPYPSNLTEEEWQLAALCLPGTSKLGRPPRYEKRAILNGIFYVVRSGGSWRMLPRDQALDRGTLFCLAHSRLPAFTRDYETKERNSAALILIAASRLMLRRLVATF
ncbi:hypothetical protein BH18VER1_BH18VER1_17640 [soil metagenome]